MPGCAPSSSPPCPNTTASTSSGPGSEVNTTSHCSATARGVSAHSAPAPTCDSAAALRASFTTSRCCDFCRLAAMKAPMVPRPMNPIFMPSALPLVLGLEHVRCDVRGGHRRGRAGVHGEVGDDLGDLLPAQPVAEPAPDVGLQLLRPAERRQRGDGDHAAVALGELRTFPKV